MLGPGVYFCDCNGIYKPAFFAMNSTGSDLVVRSIRAHGAIIVSQVLVGTNTIPTPKRIDALKPGNKWYDTEWPGGEAIAIIGDVNHGYGSNAVLNRIPEYV